MTKARYAIGENEKHEVFVQTNFWTAKLEVDVDGKRVVDTRNWGVHTDFSFQVGENEKHEILIKMNFTNAFEIYVDGKFFGKT
jgi:hypothetical protein